MNFNSPSLASKASLIVPSITSKKKTSKKPETTSKYFQNNINNPAERQFGLDMSNFDFKKSQQNRAESFKRMICSDEINRKRARLDYSKLGGGKTGLLSEESDDDFFDRLWRNRKTSEKNPLRAGTSGRQSVRKRKDLFDKQTAKIVDNFKNNMMKEPSFDNTDTEATDDDVKSQIPSLNVEKMHQTKSLLVDQENLVPKTASGLSNKEILLVDHFKIPPPRLVFDEIEKKYEASNTSKDNEEEEEEEENSKCLTPPEYNIIASQDQFIN